MNLDVLNAGAGLEVPVHLALLSGYPPHMEAAVGFLATRAPLAATEVRAAAILGHWRPRVVAAVWLLVNGFHDALSLEALWTAARAQDLAFIPVTAVLSVLDDQFAVRADEFVIDNTWRENGGEILEALSRSDSQTRATSAAGAPEWRDTLLRAVMAAGVALPEAWRR